MYQQNNLRRLAHRITITVTSLLPAAAAALGLALGAGVLLPAEAQAGSCGGNGQRPCKLWERVPSCNSGLVEDFAKGKCIKVTKNTPKAGNRRVVCGGQGQRPFTSAPAACGMPGRLSPRLRPCARAAMPCAVSASRRPSVAASSARAPNGLTDRNDSGAIRVHW